MKLSLLPGLLYTLRQLRTHEHWKPAQLAAYQSEFLRRLRAHAYAHSPFYRKYHHGLFDRPLHELPVLTKASMMENFDEFVTDRAIHLADVRSFAASARSGERFLDRYWVTATSGSSGHPGFFLFNEDEWVQIMASFARGQEWSGNKIGPTQRTRMATVASISPWHMSSQVAATANIPWRPSLRLPASQPLPVTVQQLDAFEPNVLIAYASMAGILAQEQLAGRLHIHPDVVFTSSEVLTRQTREQAQEAWGDEPFNQYGATESADIAAEHKNCRRMHLFEDLVIAEVVDDQNRPVPRGEYGARVLVTTLFSRTQPLIRYALDDSVRLSAEPHSCGLPFAVLESVQGREEDELELPADGSRAVGTVTVQPLVFNRVMDILPVSGWQIRQQSDDGLVLLLTGARDGLTDESIIEQLTRSLAREGARVPYLRIQRVAEIPKTASGKAPLVRAKTS